MLQIQYIHIVVFNKRAKSNNCYHLFFYFSKAAKLKLFLNLLDIRNRREEVNLTSTHIIQLPSRTLIPLFLGSLSLLKINQNGKIRTGEEIIINELIVIPPIGPAHHEVLTACFENVFFRCPNVNIFQFKCIPIKDETNPPCLYREE